MIPFGKKVKKIMSFGRKHVIRLDQVGVFKNDLGQTYDIQ